MDKPNTKEIRVNMLGVGFDERNAMIRELCNYIDSLPDEKVTVAEVREYVAGMPELQFPATFILDFIDNGPRKPTPYEVLFEINQKLLQEVHGRPYVPMPSMDARCQLQALQNAGYLKDEPA